MALNYKSKLFQGSAGGSGGSSLPALAGNTGKVLTVNAGETATEWAVGPAPAAAGTDKQVLFNDGGAIAGDAGLTFDKTTNALSSTGPLTLTPTADVVPITARAYSSGTNPIAQFQTSANGALSNIGHDGTWNGPVVGNVTGNVTGTSGSTTGNAATASDGLSTASGTAPLTLTLAAKGLTGSVAEFTGDAGAGGAAGTVPAPAAGDALKFLRGDKTWQSAGAGGGITNSAGANAVVKSDGTNVVATALTEASAGAFATSAGTALSFTATAPAATTGASQAGKAVTITASPAVASTDTAGAAIGGDVTITAGAAARNTSGNAAGGNVILAPGGGIGTGVQGVITGTGTTGATGIRLGNDTASMALSAYTAGGWRVGFHASGISVFGSVGQIGFTDGTTETATRDVALRRRAAANPAWGVAAATPVSYVHSMAADARAGTDTNVGGANATIQPGNGTGTGAASTLTISTPTVGSTGTTAQTLTARAVFGPKGVNIPGLATYADNTAALAGSLVAGDVYRTSTGVLMVTY
jgi:hypothetical protein